MQSHGLTDDPLALHNALVGVVDDNQVIFYHVRTARLLIGPRVIF